MGRDYYIIGERLKEARIKKHMTQEDIAEKLDVSVAFISRIERGNSHINLRRLDEICSLLDISEGYILNGTSENSKEYLNEDFRKLLEQATPEQQKLIYNIAKTIIDSNIKTWY